MWRPSRRSRWLRRRSAARPTDRRTPPTTRNTTWRTRLTEADSFGTSSSRQTRQVRTSSTRRPWAGSSRRGRKTIRTRCSWRPPGRLAPPSKIAAPFRTGWRTSACPASTTAVATAEDLGAKVLTPPTDLPNAGRHAALADPQGAAFAVHSSAMAPSPERAPAQGEFSWHELATTVDPDGGVSRSTPSCSAGRRCSATKWATWART